LAAAVRFSAADPPGRGVFFNILAVPAAVMATVNTGFAALPRVTRTIIRDINHAGERAAADQRFKVLRAKCTPTFSAA